MVRRESQGTSAIKGGKVPSRKTTSERSSREQKERPRGSVENPEGGGGKHVKGKKGGKEKGEIPLVQDSQGKKKAQELISTLLMQENREKWKLRRLLPELKYREVRGAGKEIKFSQILLPGGGVGGSLLGGYGKNSPNFKGKEKISQSFYGAVGGIYGKKKGVRRDFRRLRPPPASKRGESNARKKKRKLQSKKRLTPRNRARRGIEGPFQKSPASAQ